ncbi:Endonuclease [Actinidia chinensis var. chinensis]|uniref:Endonuclease n=1 Tax=Actinidia chinensis var. chinensis TaxID=1590841 RepID=A0A2R6QI37_ACTCC|nr:Endonuclease [Actinidia chinensis var. chinensis]
MKSQCYIDPAIPTHLNHQSTIGPYIPSHHVKAPNNLNQQLSFAPGNDIQHHFPSIPFNSNNRCAPPHFKIPYQSSAYKYQHPIPPLSPMSPNFNPNARYDAQKEVWNPSSRTEQGKQDRERGGWTPVINKHFRKKMNISGNVEVITLFIDNLPNPVDKNWLMKTFSKFGKIRDVFIPLKRNISGNRFGFVRFECPIAANRAIRTLNGTWSYDKQLGVKIAGYSRNINHSSRPNAGICPIGVVVGIKKNGEKLVSIKGKTDGAGWLSRSAVGKLNVPVDNALITEAFHDEGIKQVQVRSMGAASTSRVVWLNCTGIPLEAWCFSTFKSIGSQWGNVLTLDRETSNRVSFDKGRILIETEYNFEIDCWINVETAVVPMVSGGESELELEEDSEDEGTDDITNKFQEEIHVGGIFDRLNKDLVVGKHQSISEKQKQGIGFIETVSTSNEEVDESQHKSKKGVQVACFPVDSNTPIPSGPSEATTTSGDEGLVMINGLKFNGEVVAPETNTNGLEIVIGPFDKDPDVMVRNKESIHSQTVDREESSKFNETGNEETIKEMGRQLQIRALRKSRRKLIVDLLATQDEIAKSKSVDEIYQFTGSREMIESTDLDSTGATASTEGINQRNAIIIREAEETIKLGKILGIKFKGNEMEVCQKLIQMELSDNGNAVEAVGVDGICCIVNVYAPNDTGERELLWEELLQLKISFTDPWCLGGDLNEVRADAERSGYLNPSPGMEDLIEFINVAELHDLPLVGRRFTWTNFQASIKLSRLDRFLVSFDWCEKFNIRQWGLPRPISDHCPILISDEEKDWGPKIFRFMDAWLSHPKFMPLVKDVWENTDVNGWAGFRILKKMQALKSKLKIWNVEGFGNINIKLQAVEEKIHNLEMIEESRALDVVEAESKKNLKSELRESSRLAEILWRQKSRVNWIKLGDKNTRFFQASAAARYWKNFIGSVEVEGTWLEEPLDIKTASVNFFSKLFNEEEWQRPKLEGDLLLSLDEDAIDSLESPFLEEEVVQAVKECDNLKAPGPDGFNFSFVKKAWSILKNDCLLLFKEFHSKGRLVKGLNATFLALIPKVEGPTSFQEYRPISMVGWVYKLLAKVLAARLKRVLPSVISESQSASVGGRQILDGVLIANEIIEGWKSSKKQGLIFKIDFAKAYDCVNWGFLMDMFKMMGCGKKWCSWIQDCKSTVSISILINGSTTSDFKTKRGIRQGDPLSPFLFNIVAEGLNVLFQRAKDAELIKGVSFGRAEVNVSHLQFADDTVIFCEYDKREVISIKRILRCFELLSGLKINFSKSVLVGVNISVLKTQECAELLKCKSGELPFSYLGLPLGADPSRIATWQPVVERFKKRLTFWKRNLLALGGRITLIKSTLTNLPIYFMSLFKMLVTIANKLEKLQRQFLWGEGEEKQKIHWISWDSIARKKSMGGLGIRRLLALNSALLVRWWWRFGTDKQSLWLKVIKAKYGYSENAWLPSASSSNASSKVWGNISSIGLAAIRWWGCSWVCPATIFDLMVGWFSNSFKEVEKACWEAIFFAIIWSLWKARNELIFSNVNIVKAELIDLIKLRVAFWVKAKCNINEYSVVDIQRCLDGIRSIRRAKSATLC